MTSPQTTPPPISSASTGVFARLSAFAADIKLSHTVFALPFALLAAVLAASGMPSAGRIGLIVLCMVFARTFAMAANRLFDADLDAKNPRTRGRAIPAGRLSKSFVVMAMGVCAIGFVLSTAGFWLAFENRLPLVFSLPVLAFVGAYPFLKRFTAACHFYLGAALGLAPVCAHVAIAGTVELVPVLIGLAVLFWTAGFDILYATQDVESDRATGVWSVPARVGVGRALWIARFAHVISVGCMTAAGNASPLLGVFWFVGVGLVTVLLVVEHSIVCEDDLSKLNLAFFTINGVVSLTLGTVGVVDVVLK